MTLMATLVLMFGAFVLVLAGYFLKHRNQKTLSAAARDRRHDDQTRGSPQVFENLFESRDLEYVQRKCSPEVLLLFQVERRRLFLLWLREIRLEAAQSLQTHAQQARMSARLEPSVELKIALRYWCLCWTCALAWIMVHLLGPFRISSIARLTSRLSNAIVIAAPAGWRDASRSE